MSEICIIVTIVVYLAAMLLVGFAYSKTNNDSTDFYLGGRKMGPLVTAMSAEASDMSSWLLMGMPEFPIVKDTTPNMMNPRLYTTSYNKPQGQQFDDTAVLSFIKLQYT